MKSNNKTYQILNNPHNHNYCNSNNSNNKSQNKFVIKIKRFSSNKLSNSKHSINKILNRQNCN